MAPQHDRKARLLGASGKVIVGVCLLIAVTCIIHINRDTLPEIQGTEASIRQRGKAVANYGEFALDTTSANAKNSTRSGSGFDSIHPRPPELLSYEKQEEKRRVARYPEIRKAFGVLRDQMRGVEARFSKVIDEKNPDGWHVTAISIQEPSLEALQPIYTELTRIRRSFGVDANVIQILEEETEIFLWEYLKYPQKTRIVILSENLETGKVRTMNLFSRDDSRPVLSAEGGLIRYGDDHLTDDADSFSNANAWSSLRYKHLFEADPPQ